MQPQELISFFDCHIQKYPAFLSENRILAALSGGADSMCLLHLLKNSSLKNNYILTAGHINHQQRLAADRDQAFVEQICNRWNIPVFVEKIQTKHRPRDISPESWFRLNRYSLLDRIAVANNLNYLVTAHHLNDQLETILMRIGDGAGSAGLCGIKPVNKHIIRPLLSVAREDILKYNQHFSIPFVVDETNDDINIPRNFVRHKVIKPWLEKSPGLLSGASRVHEIAQETEELIHFIVKSVLPETVIARDKNKIRLNRKKLTEYPPLLQLRILTHLINLEIPFRYHHNQRIKQFINSSGTGSSQEIGNGWILLANRDEFILAKNELVSFDPVQIRAEEDCQVWKTKYKWRWTESKQKGNFSNRHKELIDGELLKQNKVTLRKWKPGDKFQPLGMTNYKKISDYLIDIKLDRFEKNKQLIFTVDDEIIWLCGQRISEKVKITDKTKSYVELSMTGIN